MKKNILILTILSLFLVSTLKVFAQDFEEGKKVTQEEFAVEMVKVLDIEDLLPTAALANDCVDLLNSLGIAPLKGWHPKEFLNQEDYLVIVGKAQGKEGVVHKRATEIEEKNIEIINQKWREAYEAEDQWIPLSKLLKDKKYFPNGAPKSPYGITYKDANGDHRVDHFLAPVAKLQQIRQAFSSTK